MSIIHFIFAVLLFIVTIAVSAFLKFVFTNSFPNLSFKQIGKRIKKYFIGLNAVIRLARIFQFFFVILLAYVLWYALRNTNDSIDFLYLVKPYLEKYLFAIFLLELLARGSYSLVEDLVNRHLKK